MVNTGGHLYALADNSINPVYLQCIQHELDRERVNANICTISDDGQLVSRKSTGNGQYRNLRLNNYWGTCSTCPLPLSTFPCSLTPVPPAPKYWETETMIGMNEPLKWWQMPVLEVGLVEEDFLDSIGLVYHRHRSCCVRVGGCELHTGLCTQIWNQGRHVKCVRDPLSDAGSTSQTLKYSVVVDMVKNRVVFVDVDRGVVLEKMEVEFKQTIHPVFGVSPVQHGATVTIRLIAGNSIKMTGNKRKLLHSCIM